MSKFLENYQLVSNLKKKSILTHSSMNESYHSCIGGCSKNGSDKETMEGDGCCYDEDGELPELLFSQLSLINGAWKNTSQNTHDHHLCFGGIV